MNIYHGSSSVMVVVVIIFLLDTKNVLNLCYLYHVKCLFEGANTCTVAGDF